MSGSVSGFSEQPFKQNRRAKKPTPGMIDLRTRAKTRLFIKELSDADSSRVNKYRKY